MMNRPTLLTIAHIANVAISIPPRIISIHLLPPPLLMLHLGDIVDLSTD
jgi:hypothetical protein